MKEHKISVYQNLIDCGCDEKCIQEFLQCDCKEKKLKFLENHRDKLLEKVHEGYSEIDCLDYLCDKIKKE